MTKPKRTLPPVITIISMVAIAATISMACSGGKNHRDADSATADSTLLTTDSTEHLPTLEELTLPDTAYASVQTMTYVVEVEDSTPRPLRSYDDPYAARKGERVMTFRGNQLRDADFGGRVQGTPSEIVVAWSFDTPYGRAETQFGAWGGGTGWTGQPLYAHWTEDEVDSMRNGGAPLTADFSNEEIVVGSLCGQAFFLNFQTGKPSRQPLDLHNVVKGTMSMDPELMNLYVGQGVNKGEPLGCQAFSLTTHQRNTFFNDTRAWRGWQAFDASAIVAGGYLFWTAENGSLYKFERAADARLHRVATLRYRVNGAAPGIESSLCVYRNYGFFADNHGNVVCVNLNTMRPVWHYANHDDSDGTIVCREENGSPYIYTACEVDKQGTDGVCRFVKLNALNGERIWERPIACRRIDLGNKILDGGMYSTPLLGQGDCEQLIFANICRNSAHPDRGQLTAIDTRDGSIVYTVGYGNFCWSSPVAFYNENHEMFIFTGDASGIVYLIRGKDGEVLCKQQMEANFESSPCVVGNSAVVGCRGTKIYKFIIK